MKPWMVIAHSVAYSLGVIGMTTWLGMRYLGTAAGIMAGLWLAFEPYHVHYSRSGLHEMDAMFLLMAAIALWFCSWKTSRSWIMILLGSVMMFCVGTSYRMILMVFLIVAIDIVITLRDRPGAVFHRVFGMFFGMCISFALLNAAYFLAFYPEYTWSQPASYFALLKLKFFSTGETSFCLDFPWFYLNTFRRFDGLFPLVLTVGGVIFSLSLGNRYARVMGLLFSIQFIFLSLMSPHLARAPSAILPFGALATGYSVQQIRARVSGRSVAFRGAVIGLFAVGLVIMAVNLKPVYKVRSGYTQVIEFLDSRGQSVHLTTMKPIYAAYRDRTYALDAGATLEDLKKQMEETGARYLSVDWQKYLRYKTSIMKIEETVLPVFAAVNPVGEFFATLHENHLPRDVPILRDMDPTLGYIKVYDLTTALPACGVVIQQEMGHERED